MKVKSTWNGKKIVWIPFSGGMLICLWWSATQQQQQNTFVTFSGVAYVPRFYHKIVGVPYLYFAESKNKFLFLDLILVRRSGADGIPCGRIWNE